MTTTVRDGLAVTARDGLWQLVRAEWTKLWSVRGWALTLVGAVVLSVGLSLLIASGSTTDVNRFPFVTSPDGLPVVDDFHFAHQPLTGDGTVITRVVTQSDSHEWAEAGIMMKDRLTGGARYAAVLVTPGHGVRMRANFEADLAGGPGGAGSPAIWLKLSRSGATVTGFESGDGVTWREIGTMNSVGLSSAVEVGLFVSSPPDVIIERQAGSTSMGNRPTRGTATFDSVRVEAAAGSVPVQLRGQDVRQEVTDPDDEPAENRPGGVGKRPNGGTTSEAGGVFTLTGTGKIGPNPPDDDIVQVSLFGILAGLIALVAVGALFMTSEFKRGLLRTTFTASPRRGRILAAKAIVLGFAAFAVGLVASVAAFLVAQPVLRGNGWTPPAHPTPSLLDGSVLRAILTTAAFVAAAALLSLGAGAIMRHSAAAITTVVALVVLPFILGAVLPAGAARLLMQVTPAGGMATQRAKPPTETLVDPAAMINPWVGLGVACLYAAVALGCAGWLLRRRDA